MGGEGAQWIGRAPVHRPAAHVPEHRRRHVLPLGQPRDPRRRVAAGVNITYKLLYNAAVAMTGGQEVAGVMLDPRADAARWTAEGSSRIIVCSRRPGEVSPVTPTGRRAPRCGPETASTRRSACCATSPGVTVLIYDQQCAAEKRRDRKRGVLATPTTRIFINEAVCEGCGDCGEKSNCLSVHPVETELGPKTQIHQSSCNFDYTCLEGDCPSFLSRRRLGSDAARDRRPA